jgi:hypothetical protein
MAIMNSGISVNLNSAPDSIADFAKKYGIRDIRVDRPYRPYGGYDRYSGPFDRDEVTVTLSEQALRALACDSEILDRIADQDRKERLIRARCPAVQKAWEQYQMLLEISR